MARKRQRKRTRVRVTLTLPPGVVDDLDYITERMRVSRSALVSDLLTQSLTDFRRVIELIPPSPDTQDLLRMRGQSEAIIQQRIESLRRAQDDLFSKGGSK